MTKALLALGSNLGDRRENLEGAVRSLRAVPQTKVLTVSSWRATQPAGGPSQEEFLNGAAIAETSLTAPQLLTELQRIENELGRVRDVRWGARTIDLDLLLFGTEETSSSELTVPHPRMAFRRFVLVPACEIAGDWIHPLQDVSLTMLLDHLEHSPQRLAVVGATNFERLEIELRRDHPTWQITSIWPASELLRLVVVTSPPGAAEESLVEFDRRRREPSSPPVLWLPQCQEAQLLQEVLAAVAAMG